MASRPPTHDELTESTEAARTRGALAGAWRTFMEEPGRALSVGARCHEVARWLEDPALCARARTLQGAASLHRGDLAGALELGFDAERYAQQGDDLGTRAGVAALKSQLSFFTGAYTDALSQGESSVALADEAGDVDLRIIVRRATCMVFGSLEATDLRARIQQLLDLTIESGYRWEEAISRNDLAVYFQQHGDLEAAEHEVDRALQVVDRITSQTTFARGLIHSTRSDVRLLLGRPEEALADAERSLALLTEGDDPNPYVLAATVRAEVQARMALGQLERARESGEGVLAWLGDRSRAPGA